MARMVTDPDQNPSAEAAEGEYTLSSRRLLQALWRRLWVVALTVAVLTGITVGVGLLQTPQYEASVNILIRQDQGVVETPADAVGLQNLTLTMAELVDTLPTAEGTIERLGLQMNADQLLESLEAQPVPETQLIEMTYTDSNPIRAQRVAQAVGEEFSEQITETDTGSDAVAVVVWGQASVTANPVDPNPISDGLLALVAGLFLGVGLAFLLEYPDNSLRSPEDARRVPRATRRIETPKTR